MAEVDIGTDRQNQRPQLPNSQPTAITSAMKRAAKQKAVEDAKQARRDDSIMDTNNSSIVSKRSVEKLYYPNEPEYFRHFVSKFKRRSPLINRGYWLRMKAIEHAVVQFLKQSSVRRKYVINLGCGYDPLPFMCIGRYPALIKDTVFIDIDYPQLMRRKLDMMDKSDFFRKLLPQYQRSAVDKGAMATSTSYIALGCDLNDIETTKEMISSIISTPDVQVSLLFVSEVAVAYMSKDASQAILEWTASFDDVRFCLLEQHLPDGREHPFAQTMLAHFQKIGTPLNAIGTMSNMQSRFVNAGWPKAGIDIRTLWELWSDSSFLTAEERQLLDQVEPFDEWEEFALFGSHYFVLVAEKRADDVYDPKTAQGQDQVEVEQSSKAYLQAHNVEGSTVPRRFATAIPGITSAHDINDVGLLAGIGAQDRRTDCDTYTCTSDATQIMGPPFRTGLACFTATKLGTTSNCLVVGGRTSPDKASDDCWLRHNGLWSRTRSLPQGRYRHCAIAIDLPPVLFGDADPHGVLIFGGKNSQGQVLDDWLLWSGAKWRQVEVDGPRPMARFGASMITITDDGSAGMITGGMTGDGCVINDIWRWTLGDDFVLRFSDETTRTKTKLGPKWNILGRMGAQLVRSQTKLLLVGGICANRVLTNQEEILNIDTLQCYGVSGTRPLLVGHAVIGVGDDLLVLGGGATCFSFGTYWSKPLLLSCGTASNTPRQWKMMETKDQRDIPSHQGQPNTQAHHSSQPSTDHKDVHQPADVMREALKIPRIDLTQPGFDFHDHLHISKPVVFTNGNLGPCMSTWSAKYLTTSIGPDRKVVVHSANSKQMDFQNKNFSYTTLSFADFLSRVQRGEKLYLRSLSHTSPSDAPTNLVSDFPEIASDFSLPPQLDLINHTIHSSPLRISGPVNMWLHYDVMANILCQIRGRKKLILFPPGDVGLLRFKAGSSSSSLNIFDPSPSTQERLRQVHAHETILNPGDILFIPPMWLHTTSPEIMTGPSNTDNISLNGNSNPINHDTKIKSEDDVASISINVFFRSLPSSAYAAGRDVYGNRDLAAYERGRKDVARIIKSFEDLPDDVSGFYLHRLASEMMEKAEHLFKNMK